MASEQQEQLSLLSTLSSITPEQLILEAALPAGTCIRGKPIGVSGTGKSFNVRNRLQGFEYWIEGDREHRKGFSSQATKAKAIAVDVSNALVTKRVSKGEPHLTTVHVAIKGNITVEYLTNGTDGKRVKKVYSREPENSPAAAEAKHARNKVSPEPSRNDWTAGFTPTPQRAQAQASDDKMSKERKVTDRPSYLNVGPSKRKPEAPVARSMPVAATSAPTAPLTAFKRVDQDLFSSAADKKRKVSGRETESAGQNGSASRASISQERIREPTPTVSTTARPQACTPPVKITVTAIATPSKKSAVTPASVQSASQAATTSTSAGLEKRQKARERFEAIAIAKRDQEKAQAEEKMREAANDTTALETPLIVGNMNYHPLKDVTVEWTIYNVIAVVVKVPDVRVTGKGHHGRTICLADPGLNAARDGNDLQVTLTTFKEDEQPCLEIGDVMLLRNCKSQKFDGRMKLTGWSGQWQWALLKKAFPEPVCSSTLGGLQVAEMKHMSHMLAWSLHSGLFGDPHAEGPVDTLQPIAKRQKLRRLEEIVDKSFFDCIVKVLHFNPKLPGAMNRPKAELIVADGTLLRFCPPGSDQPISSAITVPFPHDLPAMAVISIKFWEVPAAEILNIFQPGNVIKLQNVRPGEPYQGKVEFVMHDKNHQGQAHFREKKPVEIGPNSPEAKDIAARIEKLKRDGSAPSDTAANRLNERLAPTAAKNAVPSIHFKTMHDDQPSSTIQEIKLNQTIPNRYRLQARVVDIEPRQRVQDIVVKYCKKCKQKFKKAHCQSCNDEDLIRAHLRYEMVICLQQDGSEETVYVLFGSDEAACALPTLPRLAARSPNENREIIEAAKETYNLLQGAMQNGRRPQPVIDFSVESYNSGGRDNLRAFDMRAKKVK